MTYDIIVIIFINIIIRIVIIIVIVIIIINIIIITNYCTIGKIYIKNENLGFRTRDTRQLDYLIYVK